MKGVFKLALGLLLFFSCMFLLNTIFGWINAKTVRAFIDALLASPDAPYWIAATVIALLAVDSVIAVPTITTIVLGGYFLGPIHGGLAASIGVLCAGWICYCGGRFGGERFLRKLIDAAEAERLRVWFAKTGGLALMLSRCLPMLPETLSCLAGISRMSFWRYSLIFAAGNIPYAFLAAWAGSKSDLANPWPALVVGVGVPALAWLVWLLVNRSRRLHPAGG